MQMRRVWLLFCLCVMISVPFADAKGFREPRLREVLPADAVGYIRIPNPWGVISAPKGGILQEVLTDETHAQLIEGLKEAVGRRFIDLAEPEWGPVIDIMLRRLASPIELVLEMPENAPPQMATLLMSARLSIDSLEDFKIFLTGLVEKNDRLSLLGKVSPDGFAALATDGLPVFMRYDPEMAALTAMAGMAVNEAAFRERLDRLAPVEAHPMYPFENEIDESRQGGFAWVNASRLMPTITAAMASPDLEVMEKWGLTAIRGIALGWGVSDDKGRLRLMVDAPKAGYRTLFPDIENAFDLYAAGMPETVFTVSLPLRPLADALKTIGEKEEIPALPALLRQGDALCREVLKTPLTDLLEALGPELIVFRDELDTFVAVEIGDQGKLDRLVGQITAHPDASLATHERKGRGYVHLRLPSMLSFAEEAGPAGSAGRRMFSLLGAVKTHLFWMEDDGYLVFASAPQALYDRADYLKRVSIGSWIAQTQDARHSVVNLATRLAGTPSKLYYAYIQLIALLGDIANHPVDLFGLPSARRVDLPPEGAYGFQLDWSDPVVSLAFTFENNPFEFLMAQDATAAVAAAGVLAAIAIPNFQRYKTLSYDAEANTAIKNAYTAAQSYFVDYPTATVTMTNLKQSGYRPPDGVILTIEDGRMDTLELRSFHVRGGTLYVIDAAGRIESFSR